MDAVNKHMFTSTASLPTAPQPVQLVLILPTMVLLKRKDDDLHVQGLSPQPEDAEAALPDQALTHPGLLDGNPAGSQSWLSTKHFQLQNRLLNLIYTSCTVQSLALRCCNPNPFTNYQQQMSLPFLPLWLVILTTERSST